MILRYDFERIYDKGKEGNLYWDFRPVADPMTKFGENGQVDVTLYLNKPSWKNKKGDYESPHSENWIVSVETESIEEGFYKAVKCLTQGIQFGEECGSLKKIEPVPFPAIGECAFIPGDFALNGKLDRKQAR